MKNIILLIILLNSTIYANDDLNTTSLDMFLFKIGFKALASDVEEQKKLLNKNTIAIRELQKQIELISDTKIKNKLSSSLNNFNMKNSKNTIENLNKKIDILQTRLKSVLTNKIINDLSVRNLHVQKIKKVISVKPIIKNNEPKYIIKKRSNVLKKLPYKYAKVNYDNLKVHYYAKSQSKVTKLLAKNTLIKISSCNKFMWCKLYNEHSYVAKIRLRF